MPDAHDYTEGPSGNEFRAPRFEVHDSGDSLSHEALARKRATADELIEAYYRIGTRGQVADPSVKIIVGRLKIFFRRYEDVVMLAQRRYQRIKNFIATQPIGPQNERRLEWSNRLDDAWLIWKTTWDTYSEVNRVLKEPIIEAIKPPDKPEI